MTAFYKFKKQFPDDEACLLHIMNVRYGGTEIDCPSCGEHGKFYRLKRDRAYLCQHCKHHIYPCVGTPMERSRTSVHKWFYAMFLFSSSRHGVSAKELERQLGVTYKCAWRMAHEIRKFMADVDNEWPLDGDVEADETYVGGKRLGKPGRGAEGKTVVFEMLERGVDVIGCSHVNSINGFWARLKLSIRGTHVHVSGRHLWRYGKEFEFHYNRRKSHGSMFSVLLAGLSLSSSPERP